MATALALVVGLLTSFVSFFLGQAILGDRDIGIGEENVLRAVIGAGLYMALLALFSMGVATMLRSSVASISILIPFFLIVSNLLSGFEATRKYGQYLPDKAGIQDHAGRSRCHGQPRRPPTAPGAASGSWRCGWPPRPSAATWSSRRGTPADVLRVIPGSVLRGSSGSGTSGTGRDSISS